MRQTLRLVTASSVLGLTACGGGGTDATSTPTPSTSNASNTYPTALPSAGDYSVYSSLTTPTLPAGTAANTRMIIRSYRVVGADGSLTRADTASTATTLSLRNYSTDGALVSSTIGTTLCTFAPAYLAGAPRTAVVGDAYSTATTETCAVQPAGTPATYSITAAGNALAVESKAIPLGTFSAFKTTTTYVQTSSTSTSTTVETCWKDKVTAQIVECASTYSTVPAGQTAATSSGSTLFQLQAYVFGGQAPVGAAIKRFAGYWTVAFAGSSTGDCASLLVDVSGAISGSCRFMTSPGVYGASFTVTGSVNSAGAAAVTATTGATMSGTFASPGNASGAWTSGTAIGTWTAAHF